ncbi:MAG: imidazole glycerol phosphate synthase subunit HisH [Bacteroidales bacterium]
MKIAILSYGAGNVASVQNALERLSIKATISDDINTLMQADKLIFPGVGHATHAMGRIKEKGLDAVLKSFDRPLLGICLGMQLMGKNSEEGLTNGLGLMDFNVRLFKIKDKVPHMGWNSIEIQDNPIFRGIANGSFFYFVHSYYADLSKETVAKCNYSIPFTAAVCKNNLFGVQFHPEKSGDVGMELLKNFVEM